MDNGPLQSEAIWGSSWNATPWAGKAAPTIKPGHLNRKNATDTDIVPFAERQHCAVGLPPPSQVLV